MVTVLWIALWVVGCGKVETDVDVSGVISGRVDIDADLAGRLTGTERVFVVAQSLDGQPVAVQHVWGLGFPLQFCISSANILEGTGELPAEVLLSARVTLSNDPLGGGMTGTVSQPVSLGSQGVRIQITSAESAAVDAPSPATSANIAKPSGLYVDRKDAGAKFIGGIVALGVSLDGGEKSTDVLYIIVRSVDDQLLTVSAPYRQPRFPLEYKLTTENIMMGTIPDDQDVVVIARLDRDGNALSSAGDVEGECKRRPVRMGDIGADIVLNTLVR
jgi:hypothetical protein